MVSMSFGLAFPFLVRLLLDAAMPQAMKGQGSALDAAIPSAMAGLGGWAPTIGTVAIILAVTLVVQAILMFFTSYWFYQVGEASVVELRKDLYGRLISLPMKFFGEHRVGELASRLSSDLAMIQDTLSHTVPQCIRGGLMLVGGVVFIAITSLKMMLVMISTFPVIVLLAVLFGRSIRQLSRQAQDRLAESASIVEETLQGIANVKAFGNELYEGRRYGTNLASYLRTTLRAGMSRSGLISFIIVGLFGSVILLLCYGAHLMLERRLTYGEFTQFIIYTAFVGGAVPSLAEVFGQLQRTLGATERVREMLFEKPEPGLVDDAASPVRLTGEVEFTDVRFRYPSRPDVEVLRGVSLKAAAGEKIAIVGASGAGKSTLVSLLLRFYEPDAGQILFEGRDARDFSLGAIRGNMAIVPQEVLLFGGSIRDNIAYGRPGATLEEIVEASKGANCHEFIERFPQGYETLVGDRGVQISGGQRQRIAIARALLKDPAILLLDEATSSLDSASENLIQQALATLMEGRTSFIIAHRLSTVRRVDRIYVIDRGMVAECGTHAELVALDGIYRHLSDLQLADA
jgi:ATP-binding cassette subfamily B protein